MASGEDEVGSTIEALQKRFTNLHLELEEMRTALERLRARRVREEPPRDKDSTK